MALLQITEPGQTPPPHQAKYAAGIDLGTTNSLVATVRNGQAQTLPDTQGNDILPSVVHYQQHTTTVGQKAVDARVSDPKNTFFSIKRLLSKKIHDIDQNQYPYPLKENDAGHLVMPSAQGDMNPIQISADIIRALVQRAEQTLANPLQGVVITVPAHFDDSQRQATKDAAKLAGIPVLRLLNEPTAAAIAYGLNTQHDNLIAVYDLGGGTFDISILRLRQGVFEVLATGGDTALGGDDLDASIIEWLKTQLPSTQTYNTHQQAELKILVRDAKHQLSQHQQTEILFQGHTITLSRDCLNSLLEPWVKKTLQTCQRTIRDAKIALNDIKQVVLVGGSTRDPYIRQRVGDFFQQQPLCTIDPDKVVALGAAIQADILVGNPQKHEMLLLDVVPLSLGVETMGGLSEKIIHRNTTIPISRAQDFTTFKDGQTAMSIHVVQGEREQVEHCRSLAKFTLRGIPPMSAGVAQIRITFQIDADGLLCVSAMEKSTQTRAAIDVQSSYGLSEQEMSDMLISSQQHAQEDIAQRMLIEQRIEAQQRLFALEKGLQEDGQALLSEQELAHIRHACEKTQQALSQNDVQHLKQCIEQLDQASEPFAMRRMEYSIKQALTGKDVNKV